MSLLGYGFSTNASAEAFAKADKKRQRAQAEAAKKRRRLDTKQDASRKLIRPKWFDIERIERHCGGTHVISSGKVFQTHP